MVGGIGSEAVSVRDGGGMVWVLANCVIGMYVGHSVGSRKAGKEEKRSSNIEGGRGAVEVWTGSLPKYSLRNELLR